MPKNEGESEQKVGKLYGFDLFIRRQRQAYEQDGLFEYRFSNSFYASRAEDGIKYTYNNGLPNTDNPKLAARHFLNAIDRVEGLKEKCRRTLYQLETEIPKLKELTHKPFLKEHELQEMKSKLSGLEREIAIKIQENQLKQHQGEAVEKEPMTQHSPPVIQLNGSMSNGNTLKTAGELVAKRQNGPWQPRAFADMSRNKGLKL